MKIRQIVVMPIIHLIPQILPERLLLLHLEAFQITSSTPATSLRRLPTIEGPTAAIGRLLRTIASVATTCTCIAPLCTQVPISIIRATGEVLGVRPAPSELYLNCTQIASPHHIVVSRYLICYFTRIFASPREFLEVLGKFDSRTVKTAVSRANFP